MSDIDNIASGNAGANPNGIVEPVESLPRKRGRPRRDTGGDGGNASSVNPPDLDGGTGTGTGDNSGDNRSETGGKKRGGRPRSEKETPLSITDFIGILSVAQIALVQVTGAPECLLSAEQNDLLATRYAAAASHMKTSFLTKAQKDIALAIAATAAVFYTQAQAYYQRRTDETAKPVHSHGAFEMPKAA